MSAYGIDDAQNAEKVLHTVTIMADALEYYLIEGEIYRTVVAPADRGYERLTMSAGELLSLLQDLAFMREALSAQQQQQLEELRTKITTITERLPERYHQLLEREIIARLDSLNWFLNDCQRDHAACRTQYESEIRNRQRIEEMMRALGTTISDGVAERVQRIDERVREISERAPFVWPNDRQARFPHEP